MGNIGNGSPTPLPGAIASTRRVRTCVTCSGHNFAVTLRTGSPAPIASVSSLRNAVSLCLASNGTDANHNTPITLACSVAHHPACPTPGRGAINLDHRRGLRLLHPLSHIACRAGTCDASTGPLTAPAVRFRTLAGA